MSKAEKLIKDCTRNCSNEMESPLYANPKLNFYPWLTPDQARRAVEIAREEVIEKACGYLDEFIELFNEHGHRLKKERIIDGLKQAMKDKNIKN